MPSLSSLSINFWITKVLLLIAVATAVSCSCIALLKLTCNVFKVSFSFAISSLCVFCSPCSIRNMPTAHAIGNPTVWIMVNTSCMMIPSFHIKIGSVHFFHVLARTSPPFRGLRWGRSQQTLLHCTNSRLWNQYYVQINHRQQRTDRSLRNDCLSC